MRFALRQLVKNPGFAAASILTLALGIGVNTTAFTVLNQLLLKSLPFVDPSSLVQIWGIEKHDERVGISPADYLDLREANSVFEDVAAFTLPANSSFAESGRATVNLKTMAVTASFFRVFGIAPLMGRTFTPDEEKRLSEAAIISNFYWRDHFSSDPKILERVIRLNGKDIPIVGVLQKRMDDPTIFNGRVSFWTLDSISANNSVRNLTWYSVAARLKSGVTLQQAKANLTAIGLRLANEFPKTNSKRVFELAEYPRNILVSVGNNATWVVLLVMLPCALILAIACVNLANLQLVRTTRRAPEFAVRVAMGSSRGRIIALILKESLLISLLGGLLGLLVAVWSNVYVGHYLKIDMPLDFPVLAFAFAVSTATGASFGIIPAWVGSRQNPNSALKAGGRGATYGWSNRWFRRNLIIVEIALALIVLSAAAFFVHGIYALTHRQLGWNGDHVLYGEITLDYEHYGEIGDPRSVAFSEQLKEAVEAVPGVHQVAASRDEIPALGANRISYQIEGASQSDPGREPIAEDGIVAPGYFNIYRIPIVKGRDFDASDRAGTRHVVIVNETMARKCWPGEDPIGKRVGTIGKESRTPDWGEVVGVVSDYQHSFDFVGGANGMMLYKPWAQNSNRFMDFHIATSVEPSAVLENVRKAISGIAPDFAVGELLPVNNVLLDRLSQLALIRRALMELSVLGLVLAAIGIYGVIATLVSERTQEIGIRMALGATSAALIWHFLKNGLSLALTGTILGGLSAWGAVRVLTQLLPILPGYDSWAIVPIAAFLFLIASVACWIPARRSSRVDPCTALRAE